MTFSKIHLLAISAIFFIGCSNTPEGAVNNTFDALKEGHFPKLMKNTTYPISKAYSTRALSKCSVDKLKYKDDDLELMHLCLKEEYKDIKVEKITITNVSKDEADAEVTVLYDKKITHKFGIKRIDGQWRLTPPKEK